PLLVPSSASGAAPWCAAKSRRCRLIRVRLARTRQGLARNYQFAFDQVAFDNFSRDTISQTNLDSPPLGLAALADGPDNAGRAREHGRRRRRKLGICTTA